MNRRETLKAGAVVTAVALLVFPTEAPASIFVDGKRYPVTQKFRREVFGPHPDLATLSYDQLTAARERILAISNARHEYRLPQPREPMAVNGTLTLTEQARLEAITHTINVHHGVRFLQGRSHDDFGFEGVDQVHGNAHHLECGCIHTVVFDHHQRHDADLTLHPHYPRRICTAHTV